MIKSICYDRSNWNTSYYNQQFHCQAAQKNRTTLQVFRSQLKSALVQALQMFDTIKINNNKKKKRKEKKKEKKKKKIE